MSYMTAIKPIRTTRCALRRRGGKRGGRPSDYEDEHYAVDLPDPVEALKFRMEQQGLTQKDLIPLIGSKSKVSEVLSRKRRFSLSMIRALHRALGIPAEVLLQDSRASSVESQS